MGRLKKKGEAGAAVNYVTRNQALKRLQVTLADFRRLCILKGIFPREPRNKKKAAGGTTAPKTFYYSKDIAYLAHEPVLYKLREHKAFAKKLSKAVGKGDLLRAQGLEERRPKYALDHIIKERYPTFADACRDLDDALSMVHLFSHLPASDRLSTQVVANCQRLCREWQYYVMRSQSLRKVFLSIKGIYFQAVVATTSEKVTWLVPHAFAQHVPNDVDFRVMLTFLEFYQTLLTFTLYRLYSELDLAYPPELDEQQDGHAAGLGALVVAPKGGTITKPPKRKTDPRNIVREIQEMVRTDVLEEGNLFVKSTPYIDDLADASLGKDEVSAADTREEFTALPEGQGGESLVTLAQLEQNSIKTKEAINLFSTCVIFLSREVSRSTIEFVCRSFGAHAENVGWDPTLGAGSPLVEKDSSITHQIVDRPNVPNRIEGRAYVQPQWVIDSVNEGVLQSIVEYQVGETLPPHLSPFVDDDPSREGEYEPMSKSASRAVDDESEDEEAETAETSTLRQVMAESGPDLDDQDAMQRTEIAMEAAGVPYHKYQKAMEKKRKRPGQAKASSKEDEDDVASKELAKMMMGRKQRKLLHRIESEKAAKTKENEKLKQRKVQAQKKR